MVERYDWCTVVLCLILVGLGGCLVIEFQVLRDAFRAVRDARAIREAAERLQVDLFVEADELEEGG